MRFVRTQVAAVLAATMVAGVARAGTPVVVDRDGTLQQLQQLQAQLAALDQQIYGLRPQNPQAIDQLRIALSQAVQQAQGLDRYVRQAPVMPAQLPPRYDPRPPPYPPPGNPGPGHGRGHDRYPNGPGAPAVIDEGSLGEISGAIQGESFSDGKITVLRDAAGSWMFTVDQVKRLIGLYPFSADKLNALRILAPRIADRQNNFKIYEAFTFSRDKDEARKILGGG